MNMRNYANNDNPRLCIFTPTYNRISTLRNCYNSLCHQTNKEFQWLIIDDGSKDQTEETVRDWISEKKIAIKYIKKKNQGKVRAIEDSLRVCENPLWVCLDSDDELFPDAVESILEKYDSVVSEDKCCGLIGVRYAVNRVPMQGEQYIAVVNGLPERVQFTEVRYKYRIPPEYILVYKTDVLKQYEYPKYDNEKFMPESSVYCLMDADNYYYHPLKTPIMICEFRNDGLTKNHSKNVYLNPRGYTYTQGVIADNCKYFYGIIRSSVCYQVGRKLGGDIYRYKNTRRKHISSLLKPVGIAVYLLKYKTIKEEGRA